MSASVSARTTTSAMLIRLVPAIAVTWLAVHYMLADAAQDDNRAPLGKPATEEEIRGWDIDIRPDGAGLPDGSGSAEEGEPIYLTQCAACHGEFAEGAGRYPVLASGIGSLTSDRPEKTVGSYWAYATTAFDYIRRAMPFGHAQSLSDDEVYAITAYVLNASEIIEYDYVLDKNTLPQVEMPNRAGFIPDARPDVPVGEPCMTDCLDETPTIVGRAQQIDVTPETETAPTSLTTDASAGETQTALAAGNAAAGETVFNQCIGCHSLTKDEHRVGPSLHGLFGRRSGSLKDFGNYSQAMADADITWDEASLREFLSRPQEVVAGTTMPYAGMQDPNAVANLIAYLKQAAAQ